MIEGKEVSSKDYWLGMLGGIAVDVAIAFSFIGILVYVCTSKAPNGVNF